MIAQSIRAEGLQEQIKLLQSIGGDLPLAQSRAINRAASGVKTDAAREVVQVLNVTQSTVKKHMTSRKASRAVLRGEVISIGRAIPLGQFIGTRGVKSGGVSVMVKRAGGRKIIRHAFIKRFKAGVGVAMRKSKRSMSPFLGKGAPIGQIGPETYFSFPAAWPLKYRFPVSQLYGSSVEEVMNDQWPKLQALGEMRLWKALVQNINYLIQQKGFTAESGE